MAKIFNWTTKIDNNELKYCIEIIENGGIVVFPTETVYGIGTNAFCEKSVEKIYEIKQRPNEKPVSILLFNKNDISKYAEITSEVEEKIISNFMPGPITIILKRKKGVLDYIAPNQDTIGIRIPNNNIILTILEKFKLPIVAPSANISGEPSGVNFNEILKDFEDKVDICINGGKCEIAESSTIVQVVNNQIKILREGKIKKEDIEKVVYR